jgi:hypothetical protein
MVLFVIFVNLVIAYTAIIYFKNKQERKRQEAAERREEKFEELLDLIREKKD